MKVFFLLVALQPLGQHKRLRYIGILKVLISTSLVEL